MDRRDLARRAAWHRALGDEHRLALVDALAVTDRTSAELAAQTGLASNLLAFHLDVLEDAGLVTRHPSQGDGRRRYVTIGPAARQRDLGHPAELPSPADRVLFVCTHNAARSQLASGLWTARTGRPAWSAGASPADTIHPEAVRTAGRHGLDLATARPGGYDQVEVDPDLVVTVCDRAREGTPPFDAPLLHWSLREPVRPDDFDVTWTDLETRIDDLARAVAA